MLTVEECASLADLDGMREEWEEFTGRVESASFFSTWEWVEACWRHAAPGKQPFVLVARDGKGCIVALLPLARTRRFNLLPVIEVLGCNTTGYPLGDYGGPVAVPEAEPQAWGAFLDYLQHMRWVAIDLKNCMTGSAYREEQLTRLYEQTGSDMGWQVRFTRSGISRLIPLPTTFDDYLAGLGASTRQNIRRKLRRLQQAGLSIEHIPCHNEVQRNEVLEALFTLHQMRWAGNVSGGGFRDEYVRDMHRHLARRLAQRGWLDLRVVRSAHGQILGVIYNFKYRGTVYFYQLGSTTDEPWASYSLGFCLLADSIRAAIMDGYHTFDMLRGDHEYKKHFGGYTQNNLAVTVYRYAWLPALEHALRKTHGRLRQYIRSRSMPQPHASSF
jgi:CelD/BcsL family acetyltransferase involved in cellulose biosynthesis